jgi:hypothetical protein
MMGGTRLAGNKLTSTTFSPSPRTVSIPGRRRAVRLRPSGN